MYLLIFLPFLLLTKNGNGYFLEHARTTTISFLLLSYQIIAYFPLIKVLIFFSLFYFFQSSKFKFPYGKSIIHFWSSIILRVEDTMAFLLSSFFDTIFCLYLLPEQVFARLNCSKRTEFKIAWKTVIHYLVLHRRRDCFLTNQYTSFFDYFYLNKICLHCIGYIADSFLKLKKTQKFSVQTLRANFLLPVHCKRNYWATQYQQ